MSRNSNGVAGESLRKHEGFSLTLFVRKSYSSCARVVLKAWEEDSLYGFVPPEMALIASESARWRDTIWSRRDWICLKVEEISAFSVCRLS